MKSHYTTNILQFHTVIELFTDTVFIAESYFERI